MDEDLFDSKEIENIEVMDMHFRVYPHQNVLRCQNPVLIINLRTVTYQFMISGDYIPDDES
jgi:hypothetical protein